MDRSRRSPRHWRAHTRAARAGAKDPVEEAGNQACRGPAAEVEFRSQAGTADGLRAAPQARVQGRGGSWRAAGCRRDVESLRVPSRGPEALSAEAGKETL